MYVSVQLACVPFKYTLHADMVLRAAGQETRSLKLMRTLRDTEEVHTYVYATRGITKNAGKPAFFVIPLT